MNYDAVGNKMGQYSLAQKSDGSWSGTLRQQTYLLRGELLLTFSDVALDGSGPRAGVTERRTYDDAGRLVDLTKYVAPSQKYRYIDREGTLMTINVGGWLLSNETTRYDDDSAAAMATPRRRASCWVAHLNSWVPSGTSS